VGCTKGRLDQATGEQVKEPNGVFCVGNSMRLSPTDKHPKYIWEVFFDSDLAPEYPYFKVRRHSIDINETVAKDYTTKSVINFDPAEYPAEKCTVIINLTGTNEEFRVFRKHKLYKSIVGTHKHIKFVYISTDEKPDQLALKKSLETDKNTSYTFAGVLSTLVDGAKCKETPTIYGMLRDEYSGTSNV
jgi:hypothetical protein